MIAVFVTALGIVLGSFVNALVWRLHEQSRSKPKVARAELSILKGRSMCPQCHHTLAAKDLVPVVSWLWLRGRCRYCTTPISPQYPLVEVLTGLLFLGAYLAWPLAFNVIGMVQLGFFVLCIVFFVALALYDMRWFLLPDKLVFPLVALGALEVMVVAVFHHSVMAVWQPVLGAAILYGLFWGLYQVSNGEWIGGGDVKLALALGLIAGTPLRAAMIIFLASLLGTLASFPLLLRGKRGLTQHIPFGPYLLLSCYIVVLLGGHIEVWYKHVLL